MFKRNKGGYGDRNPASVIAGGALDIRLLERLSRRPGLYEGNGLSFWQDPYVADQLLDSFLDPAESEPSRQEPYTSMTVEAIAGTAREMGVGGGNLLDLGSGAGHYDEAFADLGFSVTGIDYCRPALEHARESAGDLDIRYVHQDIRSYEPEPGKYSVATIIYGTFGVLSPAEQSVLLDRVYEALCPGGLMVFDVFTDHYARRVRGGDGWHAISGDGFWASEPHLALVSVHRYPQGVSLERNVVISEDGSYRVFDSWWKSFTRDEITDLVQTHRFELIGTYGSIWKSPVSASGEWIGVYCRKPDSSKGEA